MAGSAPRDTERTTSPAGIPTAQLLAAAPAALPGSQPWAGTPKAPVKGAVANQPAGCGAQRVGARAGFSAARVARRHTSGQGW